MITNGQIEPNTVFTFIVSETMSLNKRIDVYITELFTGYSRNFLQQVIHEGGVTINGKIIRKASATVSLNDSIAIQFPAKRKIEPNILENQTFGVSIVAKTEHFIIINKPAHLLVHPSSNKSTAVTLIDWILHNHSDVASIGSIDRPGIIHRLDKETSGLLIITRTNHAHTVFGNLFKNRTIKKTYKAIVMGHPQKEGVITLAIGRDPINRIKMSSFNENFIDETGKIGSIKVRHAKTEYKVLEYFDDTSLIEVKPTTGRTHQIRVHMAALGHPIIGDQLYGKKSSFINRQALHAENLSFSFDEKTYSFSCEIPEDFELLIAQLRKSSQK